jgi:hypothetical protein
VLCAHHMHQHCSWSLGHVTEQNQQAAHMMLRQQGKEQGSCGLWWRDERLHQAGAVVLTLLEAGQWPGSQLRS